MCVIDGAMIGAAALRSLALTLSMPGALAAQRVGSCFSTNDCTICKKLKLSSTRSVWSMCVLLVFAASFEAIIMKKELNFEAISVGLPPFHHPLIEIL